MNDLETMLAHLRDADAMAEAAVITDPKKGKAVAGLRRQLADLIEAVEALAAAR